MGCGVACVAFLARCSYAQALRFFADPTRADGGRGYRLAMLVEALDSAGLHAERHGFGRLAPAQRIERIKALPSDGLVGRIVKAERYRGDQDRHYVVFASGVFVDPLDDDARRKEWRPQKHGQFHSVWPRRWVALSYLTVTKRA
jgi:hypothetical protein